MSGLLNPDETDFKKLVWCWIRRKHNPVWMAGGRPPFWRCARCHKTLKVGGWNEKP